MTSRVLRALVLSVWLYSFLAWLYVVARIIVSRVKLATPFINEIPSISIWVFGAVMFLLSFIMFFIYLAVWWRPRTEG